MIIIVRTIMCKLQEVGLHEWCVCLHQQLIQWDHLDEEFCVDQNQNSNWVKLKKLMTTQDQTRPHGGEKTKIKIIKMKRIVRTPFSDMHFMETFDDGHNSKTLTPSSRILRTPFSDLSFHR